MRAAFGGDILPVSAPTYFIDSHYLDPGQTAVFDIGQLRDQQIPDPKGVRLPKNSVMGQFRWNTIFGDGTQRLISRNEVLDEASGISASFSCTLCNCPPDTDGAYISPNLIELYIDAVLGGVVVNATTENICSGASSDYTYTPSFWTFGAPNVLSLTSGQPSSTLTGIGPGSSRFSTSFMGVRYKLGTGKYPACVVASRPVLNPFGDGNVYDTTPVITGIDPSDWNSGTNTPGVIFSGQYFGTNAPTLSFSPGAGIGYTLVSYNDTQIVANITVAPGTPNEAVSVSVTNHGYGGSSFNGGAVGQSATSPAFYATIHSPLNTPEVTVIAWVNGQAPDLITLPSGANSTLISNLNSSATSCGIQVAQWVAGIRTNLATGSDVAYANAWLVKNSANTAPPPTILPTAQYGAVNNYRLFNDFGHGGGAARVGNTPDPCGIVPTFILDWLSTGEPFQYMGFSNTFSNGSTYLLSEGRVGNTGQLGSQTINQRTVPWIWSVIEFGSSGSPDTSDHAIFPTYSVYINGSLSTTCPQSSVSNFTALDDTTSVRFPGQIVSE